jgi:hypothetical protein
MSINNMSIHECFDDYKSRETSIAIEILEQGVRNSKSQWISKLTQGHNTFYTYILSIYY